MVALRAGEARLQKSIGGRTFKTQYMAKLAFYGHYMHFYAELAGAGLEPARLLGRGFLVDVKRKFWIT
jgi:hypothetical protein